MKKIYSILLMAVALLISTNLKADVTVTSYAELRNAIEVAGNGSTINVTLGRDITLDAPISIYAKYADAGNVVNLDLNGKTITADAGAFKVYKGTLNLNGSGTITSTQGTGNTIDMIVMYGSPVSTDANWSILNVGQNVKVINWGSTDSKTGKEKGNAITVMGFFAAQYRYVPATTELDEFGAWNEQLVNPASVSSTITTKHTNGIQLYQEGKIDYGTSFYPYGYYNVAGYVKNTSGDTYDVDAYYIKDEANYWTVYNCYCKSDGKGGYKSISNNARSERSRAFGVVVNIDGYVYGNRYAFKTNGTIVYNSGNIPVVNINPTADIRCKENGTTSSVAVYSSGYSKVNIKGTVSGSAPVYIKSGEVVIEDAVITCTNNEFQSIAGGASGIEGSGAAITVESNSHYAGGQQLTIKGDTKVTAGADGVAVQETIDESDESKVSHITIQGGQLEGGANGAVLLENNTVQDGKVTIYGATAEGNITVEGNPATTEEVVALLQPEGIETYVVEVTDETGNTTYVITEGTAPDVAEVNFNINNATAGADIDLSASGLVNKEQELTVDKKLGTLIINNENNVTLTIAANKTLEVEKLILNEKAQIVVKAGAKLIVNGNQGITAPSVNNIIIEADGTSNTYGEFYFNPAVTSNKHPNATVQLISKGSKSGSTYTWQRFGVPAYNYFTPAQMIKNYSTEYYYWGNEEGDWVNITTADFQMKPFIGYMMAPHVDAAAGELYQMPCELVGNTNAPITYKNGWNYFANSYTGQMDVDALLSAILSEGVVEGGIRVHKPLTNTWDAISYYDLLDDRAKQTKLDPMQAFLAWLPSADDYADTINYNDVVWSHKDEAKVSRIAAREAANWDRAIIVISSNNETRELTLRQGEQFSADYDNGADLKLFNRANFNIYAETEMGEMEQVASDNLYGQMISVETNNVASFKMTFENLNGETFAIRDNVTGSVIDMTENAEYYFTADAYNGENRFEIVEARKMPTDVEVVDAAKAQKGIYSLVGAYLGEDLDVLPAGIYVVDGVKVVK